ncbi:hypothetical protein H4582DRAFT_2063354 [Lactarius indigo]|nr:hypothetical protein H4582DRAFT_2063354 [Lactarius indigo]
MAIVDYDNTGVTCISDVEVLDELLAVINSYSLVDRVGRYPRMKCRKSLAKPDWRGRDEDGRLGGPAIVAAAASDGNSNSPIRSHDSTVSIVNRVMCRSGDSETSEGPPRPYNSNVPPLGDSDPHSMTAPVARRVEYQANWNQWHGNQSSPGVATGTGRGVVYRCTVNN